MSVESHDAGKCAALCNKVGSEAQPLNRPVKSIIRSRNPGREQFLTLPKIVRMAHQLASPPVTASLIRLFNPIRQQLILGMLFIILKRTVHDYLANFLKLNGALTAQHQFQNPFECVLR